MGSYCPSDGDVRKVIDLCPHVEPRDVRRDLIITRSVEATVNRIFDGNPFFAESTHSFDTCVPALKQSCDSATNRSTSASRWTRVENDGLPVITSKKRRVPSATVTISDLNTATTTPVREHSDNCDVDTVSLSSGSDCKENTNSHGITHNISSSEDEADSSLTLPSLSERLQEKRRKIVSASNQSSTQSSTDLQYGKLYSKSSTSFDLACSTSKQCVKEPVPRSSHFSLHHSSPRREIDRILPRSSNDYVDGENSCDSVSCRSVSSYAESLSTVTTMESQFSVDESPGKAKKKRRTPEEVAEQKRLAEQKKQERERERLENKKKKDLEKAQKKAAVEARRCLKPGECQKYVSVQIDTNIIQSTIGPALLKVLQEADVQYEVVTQPVPASVTWTRKILDQEVDGATLQQKTRIVNENSGVLIVPVQEFVSMIHATLHIESTDLISLPEFAWNASATLSDKNLSLIVQGMEKYFRDVKTLGQRQFKDAVRSTDPSYNNNKKQKGLAVSIVISRFDMEQALLELQLSPAGCSVSLVETAEEAAKVIFRHTKAIAEAPFKQGRNQSGFSFLPENKGCVKVDKDGAGLLKLWKQQLCQFHNLSPEIANAIVAEYQSPQLLLQAYSRCQTKKAGENLLADIKVRRGAGVLETSRRVGKEMSRRIYELFTTNDPNVTIK